MTRGVLLLALMATLSACQRTQEADAPVVVAPAVVAPSAAPTGAGNFPPQLARSPALVRAARRQVGVTVRYDPSYVAIAYPNGDVAEDRGVCTDVIVRALRDSGFDLQREIHDDRVAHRADYPAPDTPVDGNIDHRRVPNQMAWFQRRGWALPITQAPADYRAGDVVAWKLRGSGLLHIGIVSDRAGADGSPLVLHNIGAGTREEPLLFRHPIIGHYRPVLPQAIAFVRACPRTLNGRLWPCARVTERVGA